MGLNGTYWAASERYALSVTLWEFLLTYPQEDPSVSKVGTATANPNMRKKRINM